MIRLLLFLYFQASWHNSVEGDTSNGALGEDANLRRGDIQPLDCSTKPENSKWPHEYDCNKYYKCGWDDAEEKQCPPGHHFSREWKFCDSPEYAGCEKRTYGEGAYWTRSDYEGPYCPSNEYFSLPHEYDCNKHYFCSNGHLSEERCAPGRHFNQEERFCDYPEYAKCQSKFETTLLSNYLRWSFSDYNPRCNTADHSRSNCIDIRLCRSALASLAVGGWPTLCRWTDDSSDNVCCDFRLVLGEALFNKVNEEETRGRECGSKSWAPNLSPTENEFLEVLRSIPKGHRSDPDKIEPPFGPGRQSSPFPDRKSRQKDFPWMVAIFEGNLFRCGGSLISRRHVITSAHCVVSESGEAEEPSKLTVRMGNIDLDGGVHFSIVKIKLHEKYLSQQNYYDIAILTLEKEILTPHIAHICLPDENIVAMDLTGKKTTLLGWKETAIARYITPIILHIDEDIPVVSTAQCQDVNQKVNKSSLPEGITSDFICAGRPESGKGACQEDSGGQLMYKNNYLNLPDDDPNIPWVLVGIASFSHSCDESEYPGVYTRVSSFMKWIRRNTS